MEEKRPRVYVCEDCTEGILSAVYEAYLSRYGHKYITIETENFCQPSFFCDYIQVPTDIEHGESVARAIMKKISGEAWHWVYMASMAGEPGKAQHIYRFLNMGFANPEKVCSALTQDDVLAVYKLSRKVGRETDKLMGFVRLKNFPGESFLERLRQSTSSFSFWEIISRTGSLRKTGFSTMKTGEWHVSTKLWDRG